jgi:glutamine kinase
MKLSRKKNIISYSRASADIFHYGHLRLFKKAKKISDYHICGLYSDELCEQWNGSLIMNLKERKAILKELNCVDEVIEQTTLDPEENIKKIHKKYPDSKIILFQGHQKWAGPGTSYVKSIGGEIIRPKYYPRLKRSSIKDKLNNINTETSLDIESYVLGDITYFPLYNSTKANTLTNLKTHLKKSDIEEIFVFTKGQWKKSKKNILIQLTKKFNSKVVVRSSSLVEDSFISSYAGFFHSELNINPKISKELEDSIKRVFASYNKHKNTSDNDQILIQSQTKDVAVSGVCFTRNIQSNAPYYFINYDTSSSTESVTSGEVGKKLEISKNVKVQNLQSPWKQLVESIKEIEEMLDNLALDIEFAVTKSGKVVIFQVRPIAHSQKFKNIPDQNIFLSIKSIKEKYKNFAKKSYFLSNYTLSDMSFWNPAEIIGDRSDNLAYSLYRHLILNKAWNVGLVPLGYKKIERDLIIRLGNKSYIEVETSFAALLPENLSNKISRKLISFYIDKLNKTPELHDKIEFEIVHNCFTPNTINQLKDLKEVLNKQELKIFRDSLILQTQNIFTNYEQLKINDLKDLKELSIKRKHSLKKAKNASIKERIKIIVNLLNDARELGTSQFSRMARLAFIGNQYLKGLVSRGIISDNDAEYFLLNIETVASNLSYDFDSVLVKKMTISDFNKFYGHLRPGTYDIKKLPYRKDPSYFTMTNNVTKNIKKEKKIKNKRLETHHGISKFLKDFEISISKSQLLNFIKETTKYRESFKFEFTKNLSLSLELLAEIGKNLGFTREDLSSLSIESLFCLTPSTEVSEIVDLWSAQINGKNKNDEIYSYLTLPSLIFDEKDFEIIHSYTSRPNFITNLNIKADLIDLDSLSDKNYDSVSGCIVLLEKADPGYDWIFSKKIAGLITRFGGAASHMAIRCSEFGIPAAIGCGEEIFNKLKTKNMVEINCEEKRINC